MRSLLLYFASFLFVVSCANRQQVSVRNNKIKQIFFATGGCYGQCYYLAIEIDSALNYYFQGNKYTNKLGTFRGKISQPFWDTLNIKFENIQFEKLDTSYEHSTDDLSTEIIICYENHRKHIIGQSSSLPPELLKIYEWLILSEKAIDLKPVFQTSIQNPHEPRPLKNELKVSPPKP